MVFSLKPGNSKEIAVGACVEPDLFCGCYGKLLLNALGIEHPDKANKASKCISEVPNYGVVVRFVKGIPRALS